MTLSTRALFATLLLALVSVGGDAQVVLSGTTHQARDAASSSSSYDTTSSFHDDAAARETQEATKRQDDGGNRRTLPAADGGEMQPPTQVPALTVEQPPALDATPALDDPGYLRGLSSVGEGDGEGEGEEDPGYLRGPVLPEHHTPAQLGDEASSYLRGLDTAHTPTPALIVEGQGEGEGEGIDPDASYLRGGMPGAPDPDLDDPGYLRGADGVPRPRSSAQSGWGEEGGVEAQESLPSQSQSRGRLGHASPRSVQRQQQQEGEGVAVQDSTVLEPHMQDDPPSPPSPSPSQAQQGEAKADAPSPSTAGTPDLPPQETTLHSPVPPRKIRPGKQAPPSPLPTTQSTAVCPLLRLSQHSTGFDSDALDETHAALQAAAASTHRCRSVRVGEVKGNACSSAQAQHAELGEAVAMQEARRVEAGRRGRLVRRPGRVQAVGPEGWGGAGFALFTLNYTARGQPAVLSSANVLGPVQGGEGVRTHSLLHTLDGGCIPPATTSPTHSLLPLSLPGCPLAALLAGEGGEVHGLADALTLPAPAAGGSLLHRAAALARVKGDEEGLQHAQAWAGAWPRYATLRGSGGASLPPLAQTPVGLHTLLSPLSTTPLRVRLFDVGVRGRGEGAALYPHPGLLDESSGEAGARAGLAFPPSLDPWALAWDAFASCPCPLAPPTQCAPDWPFACSVRAGQWGVDPSAPEHGPHMRVTAHDAAVSGCQVLRRGAAPQARDEEVGDNSSAVRRPAPSLCPPFLDGTLPTSYPLASLVPALETVLPPGSALLVPSGWAYAVRAVGQGEGQGQGDALLLIHAWVDAINVAAVVMSAEQQARFARVHDMAQGGRGQADTPSPLSAAHASLFWLHSTMSRSAMPGPGVHGPATLVGEGRVDARLPRLPAAMHVPWVSLMRQAGLWGQGEGEGGPPLPAEGGEGEEEGGGAHPQEDDGGTPTPTPNPAPIEKLEGESDAAFRRRKRKMSETAALPASTSPPAKRGTPSIKGGLSAGGLLHSKGYRGREVREEERWRTALAGLLTPPLHELQCVGVGRDAATLQWHLPRGSATRPLPPVQGFEVHWHSTPSHAHREGGRAAGMGHSLGVGEAHVLPSRLADILAAGALELALEAGVGMEGGVGGGTTTTLQVPSTGRTALRELFTTVTVTHTLVQLVSETARQASDEGQGRGDTKAQRPMLLNITAHGSLDVSTLIRGSVGWARAVKAARGEELLLRALAEHGRLSTSVIEQLAPTAGVAGSSGEDTLAAYSSARAEVVRVKAILGAADWPVVARAMPTSAAGAGRGLGEPYVSAALGKRLRTAVLSRLDSTARVLGMLGDAPSTSSHAALLRSLAYDAQLDSEVEDGARRTREAAAFVLTAGAGEWRGDTSAARSALKPIPRPLVQWLEGWAADPYAPHMTDARGGEGEAVQWLLRSSPPAKEEGHAHVEGEDVQSQGANGMRGARVKSRPPPPPRSLTAALDEHSHSQHGSAQYWLAGQEEGGGAMRGRLSFPSPTLGCGRTTTLESPGHGESLVCLTVPHLLPGHVYSFTVSPLYRGGAGRAVTHGPWSETSSPVLTHALSGPGPLPGPPLLTVLTPVSVGLLWSHLITVPHGPLASTRGEDSAQPTGGYGAPRTAGFDTGGLPVLGWLVERQGMESEGGEGGMDATPPSWSSWGGWLVLPSTGPPTFTAALLDSMDAGGVGDRSSHSGSGSEAAPLRRMDAAHRLARLSAGVSSGGASLWRSLLAQFNGEGATADIPFPALQVPAIAAGSVTGLGPGRTLRFRLAAITGLGVGSPSPPTAPITLPQLEVPRGEGVRGASGAATPNSTQPRYRVSAILTGPGSGRIRPIPPSSSSSHEADSPYTGWDPVAHTAGLDTATRLAVIAQLHAACALSHAHLVEALGRDVAPTARTLLTASGLGEGALDWLPGEGEGEEAGHHPLTGPQVLDILQGVGGAVEVQEGREMKRALAAAVGAWVGPVHVQAPSQAAARNDAALVSATVGADGAALLLPGLGGRARDAAARARRVRAAAEGKAEGSAPAPAPASLTPFDALVGGAAGVLAHVHGLAAALTGQGVGMGVGEGQEEGATVACTKGVCLSAHAIRLHAALAARAEADGRAFLHRSRVLREQAGLSSLTLTLDLASDSVTAVWSSPAAAPPPTALDLLLGPAPLTKTSSSPPSRTAILPGWSSHWGPSPIGAARVSGQAVAWEPGTGVGLPLHVAELGLAGVDSEGKGQPACGGAGLTRAHLMGAVAVLTRGSPLTLAQRVQDAARAGAVGAVIVDDSRARCGTGVEPVFGQVCVLGSDASTGGGFAAGDEQRLWAGGASRIPAMLVPRDVGLALLSAALPQACRTAQANV